MVNGLLKQRKTAHFLGPLDVVRLTSVGSGDFTRASRSGEAGHDRNVAAADLGRWDEGIPNYKMGHEHSSIWVFPKIMVPPNHPFL